MRQHPPQLLRGVTALTVRDHPPCDPRLSRVAMAMAAATVANLGVLRDIFFLRLDRSVLSRENHEYMLPL